MQTVQQLGCVFLLHLTFLLKCSVVIGFLFLQGGFYIELCLYINIYMYTHILIKKYFAMGEEDIESKKAKFYIFYS